MGLGRYFVKWFILFNSWIIFIIGEVNNMIRVVIVIEKILCMNSCLWLIFKLF